MSNTSLPATELAPLVESGSLAKIMNMADTIDLAVREPFSEPIRLLESLVVAGTAHIEGIADIVEGLPIGSELSLVRDPENIHDAYAIEIHDSAGKRVGYVPCDSNEAFAHLLDAGKRLYATIISIEQCGTWNRIETAVYLDD